MTESHFGYKTINPRVPNNMGWENAMLRTDPSGTTNMLHRQFQQQSVENSIYKYPHFILADDKLLQQNRDVLSMNLDHSMLVINNDPNCVEHFNVRNLSDAASLQEGYSRNIDLDSELKRINHIDDKCFYDNYKQHPATATHGGLYCHRRALINDYSTVDPYIGSMGKQTSKQPSKWFQYEGHEKQRPAFQGRYHHIADPNTCFDMARAPTAKWESAYGSKNAGDPSGNYLLGNPLAQSGGEKIFNNVTNRNVMVGPHSKQRLMPC